MPSNNDSIFIKNYRSLTDSQKKAVDTVDGPILVIAGPGTGKTQLLSLRAANILRKTDTLPENILCLTYTEVGASNMRDRISQLIGKQAYDVNISTYHGFGNEIINHNREYFSDFQESLPIDAISQYEIMDKIYSKLTARNVLWRKDTYLKDVLAAIGEIKANNITVEQLKNIARDNRLVLSKLNPIILNETENLNMRKKESISIFHNLFIELQKKIKDRGANLGVSPLDQLLLTELASALLEADTIEKTTPLTTWKNRWLRKNAWDKLILNGSIEIEKLEGLIEIYEKYQNELTKRNIHDYNDMIIEAIKGLESNDELRLNLQEKYQYIMLDEFQDTNLSQLKMIELLTNNEASEGKPNVLAVGDDDQAIFSFQGADFTNMLRFNAMYKDVSHITLKDNWRSHENIVNMSATIASQINDRISDKEGFEEKTIKSKVSKNQSKIERLNFETDSSEMSWIASEIDKLIKNGVKMSEIAVISPKHKYLESLVSYLNRAEIPINYEKKENILENKHILNLYDMANLIIALNQNDNRLANQLWPKVLSQEHWGIDLMKIWEISWKANELIKFDDNLSGNIWLKSIIEDSQLTDIGSFFAHLALIIDTESLENIIDYITGSKQIKLSSSKRYTTPYRDYYFSKDNLNSIEYLSLLSNLIVIREKIRQRQNGINEVLHIRDFIDFKQAYQNADEKLINTSPYVSSTDAVNLLTAFGAKGLEFEYVFIMGAVDDIWGLKTRSQNSNFTWPINMEILKRAGQTKDEKIRLLYVAITRSKHTLYITSHSRDSSGKIKSSLEFLEEYEDNSKIVSPNIKDNQIVKQLKLKNNEIIESLESYWTNIHFELVNKKEVNKLLLERQKNYQISPTDINHFVDIVNYGPESFYINKILRFPQGTSLEASYGSAVHSSLELALNQYKANNKKPTPESLVEIYLAKLKKNKLTENDYLKNSERGIIELNNFAKQWFVNLETSSLAEFDFRNEGCFIGEAHLTGKIDHIIINEKDKTLRVVDFKTGKPHNKWSNNISLHKYRQQLLFYKYLVESSNRFKKYKAIEASLVFVSPDEHGLVKELSIDLTSEKINDELYSLEKLVKSLYTKIKNLNFPDTNQYSKDLKGILSFEKWLIEN